MGEFVGLGYKKNLGKAKNHIKYIAFRERSDGKNYGLFNDISDNVNVYKFNKTLDDRKISHDSAAKIHTVLISMSGNEFNRSGFIEQDYKDMVRNIMEDWQLKEGKRVNWVAAIHNEDGHPHVHIAIKSTYTDRNGIERKLNMKIDKEQRDWFRSQFREEKDAIRGPDWYQRGNERAYRKTKRQSNSITKDFVNVIFQQYKLRALEAEREQDMEQTRAHRKAQQQGRGR